MKILYYRNRILQETNPSTPPTSWKSFLLPWMEPEYHVRDFGATLLQRGRGMGFSVDLLRVVTDRPVSLSPYFELPLLALQCTLNGGIRGMLNGYGELQLLEGYYNLFYVPAGEHSAGFEPGTTESLHIGFEYSIVEELLISYPDLERIIANFREGHQAGISFSPLQMQYNSRAELEMLLHQPSAQAPLLLHKVAFALLHNYLEQYRERKQVEAGYGQQREPGLLAARDAILANPNIAEHSNTSLARIAGMGLSRFKSRFCQLFGRPPAAFLREAALERAHHLTLSTNRSVSDIAFETGYGNAGNLIRAFRRRYGSSPAGLRKAARQGGQKE